MLILTQAEEGMWNTLMAVVGVRLLYSSTTKTVLECGGAGDRGWS